MGDRVNFANILRGLAAVSVLFSHYFGVFWSRPDAAAALVNAPQIAATDGIYCLTWLAKDHLYFNSGSFGVALFFLISGFVIPFSFQSQSRVGFIVSRFMRLWPTYAVGLTTTLLFVWLSSIVFGRSFPFTTTAIAWNYGLGLRDLARAPDMDGIVWTLEIEVRFYLLCLIMAPWLRAGRLRAVVVAAAAVALAGAAANHMWPSVVAAGGFWVGPVFAASLDSQMILFMLIGTLLNFHMRGHVRSGWLLALITVFFLACGALWRQGLLAPGFLSGMGSYTAALVVFSACYRFRERIGMRGTLESLASTSYSLYVMHAVPGYAIMRIALEYGFRPWTCLGMALVWVFASTMIVHQLIEEPTHKLGRKWARSIVRRHAPTSHLPVALATND